MMDADDFYPPGCKFCGSELELASCWHCHGDGGWHDCGEDCCCCADPEPNEECPVCDGRGEYFECPALPHEDVA